MCIYYIKLNSSQLSSDTLIICQWNWQMAQLGRVFVASFFLVDGMQWLSKHTLMIGGSRKAPIGIQMYYQHNIYIYITIIDCLINVSSNIPILSHILTGSYLYLSYIILIYPKIHLELRPRYMPHQWCSHGCEPAPPKFPMKIQWNWSLKLVFVDEQIGNYLKSSNCWGGFCEDTHIASFFGRISVNG